MTATVIETSSEPNATHRYRALDSIRGIAAAIVVLSHFSNLSPLYFLRRTPLRLILGGHESVLVFFVLSGFVLTLQIASTRHRFVYVGYAVQRFLRIYPPYLVAFLVGLACYTVAEPDPAAWAGSWFQNVWQPRLPPNNFAGHVALVLPFHTDTVVPVIWTLVYEMRISFILPLCVYLAQRTAPQNVLLAAVAVSGISCFVTGAGPDSLLTSSLDGAWIPTLHYAALFMLGVSLALHRDKAIAFVRARTWAPRVLVLGLVLFFTGSPLAFKLQSMLGDFLYDWIVACGAALIILSVLSDEKLAQRLRHRVLTFFGDISYSLYLLHSIVLLTVVHVMGDRIPHFATIGIALVLIVPVAYLSYRLVEVPAIAYGREAAAAIRERFHVVA